MESNIGSSKTHGVISGENKGMLEYLDKIQIMISECVLLLVNLELFIGNKKSLSDIFFYSLK